ncbi:uncharacterized protein LOC107619584 isoform X2 [Arachis ipaensis]|uniref:uncharacterized protein LOC107619584 isoform X2 n=1 Tax=Arachis ipaensis TaxID=130454 RepID=UPI0007AF7F52|nr:uncharacterized protein LOC107619584 isoform X2 [Arachis ipaensis]XP_025679694.1 uncharacterized protein LOC112779593 isoform X3 [Arachis hypogaea]
MGHLSVILVTFLLLQTLSATTDFLSPIYGTLNYSCMEAPAPSPHKERRSNESVFDACFWVDCGGGSCNKTSPFSYSCHCDAGYYNILNATAFPCVKQCAIGIGCSNLGIPMTNSSTTAPPPTLSASASSTLQGSCIGLLMLIMFMASIQLH